MHIYIQVCIYIYIYPYTEVSLIESRMPLVASSLDVAMKKRCVDICLRLIQKVSTEKKNKALIDEQGMHIYVYMYIHIDICIYIYIYVLKRRKK
jgi:hypothetical protein